MPNYAEESRRLVKILAETLKPSDLDMLVDILGDNVTDDFFYTELRLEHLRRRPTPPAPR